MERLATWLRAPRDLVVAYPLTTFILFFAAFPFLSPYHALATQVLIFGLFALAFNIVYTHAGLFSLGHAAFFGLGAYGTGLILPSAYGTGALIAQYKVESLWIGMVAGIALATLGALIIGALCLRRRGIYFSMLTLAFAQLLYFVAFQARSLTGGHSGLRGIPAFKLGVGSVSVSLENPLNFYYFAFGWVVLCVFAMRRMLASPFGAVSRAIRDNPARAAACGHNVSALRLVAFTLSGCFAGVSGALNALHLRIVSVDVLHWSTSAKVVIMTLLGGGGSFFGPFIGAGVFLLLEDEVSHFTEYWSFVIGLILILCVRFLTDGVSGWLLRIGRGRAAAGTAGGYEPDEAPAPEAAMAMAQPAGADRKAGP
jgi:branched-chain amino acid transport system permease protein